MVLNGLFTTTKLLPNLMVMQSTWPAPSHLRPLTVYFIPFLNAKPKHLEKYIDLYANYYQTHPRPLHILLQIPSVLDFALALKTASLVRRNLKIIFDTIDPADKLLLHGISIGCFLDAAHMQADKEDIFVQYKGTFHDRIVGQLYDSPVYGGPAKFGLPRMIDGMTQPIANPALKRVAQMAANGYFSAATTRVAQMDLQIKSFIEDVPAVPTLALTSREDYLCDTGLFEEMVIHEWEQRMGDRLLYHCFDHGEHARHIQTHPEVYRALFNRYLDKVQPMLELYDQLELTRDGGEEEEEEKRESAR